VLESLQLQIKELDRTIKILADNDERCKVLQTIPGIGPITAFAFAVSIGDPKRFNKARSAGAYFGLTPKRDQSGKRDVLGRITKCGDHLIRSYLFEAAGCILARTKSYSSLKNWGLRVKKRSGWKKACVAVARKLAVIMCKMMQTGECFRFGKEAPLDHAALTIVATA
jgi:transposase